MTQRPSLIFRKKEKGVALIVVMLIVALITVLAAQMTSRLQLNVARTVNIKANNQAYWYALGAEQFAQQSLATLKALTGDNINLNQPWAQPFEYPIEGGSISANLTDMQACFNLNGVSSTPSPAAESDSNNPSAERSTPNPKPANQNREGLTASQKAFQTLLENYIVDSIVTDTIRDSLIDWIDEDSTALNYGAEDIDYESLVRPYLAANSPLSHTSELRLINGVDEIARMGGLSQLKDVICVLPETRLKVNVNTIQEENAVVLSALLGDTSDIGANVISSRPEDGFEDKDDFLALPEIKALELSEEQKQWFDVTTQYFKLNTTAKYQGAQFRLSTVFRLDDGGVTVVSREFGGAF